MSARSCLWLICLAMALLTACAAQIASPLPTSIPTEMISTLIAMTVEAMGINAPTAGPTATLSGGMISPSATPLPPTQTLPLPKPAAQPTLTPSPTPPSIPFAAVQFLSPGPASRVTSPFIVSALFIAGPKGLARLELMGEDGRLLMRDVRYYDAPPYAQVNAGFEVKFEIPGVAEAGRVQIAVEDEAGRILALASVDVILLSMGDSDLNAPGDFLENIVIEQPLPNALIQGGKVRVSGLARPRSVQPLMIELQTADGKVVGSRQVSVVANPAGGHGTFVVDVPYTVAAPTRVRLVVWERGERVPGMVHLSSVEVLISP